MSILYLDIISVQIYYTIASYAIARAGDGTPFISFFKRDLHHGKKYWHMGASFHMHILGRTPPSPDEGNSPLWYHSCHKDPGAFSPGKFWNYLLSTRVLICSILRTLFSHFRRSTTEFKVFNWQHYIHLI